MPNSARSGGSARVPAVWVACSWLALSPSALISAEPVIGPATEAVTSEFELTETGSDWRQRKIRQLWTAVHGSNKAPFPESLATKDQIISDRRLPTPLRHWAFYLWGDPGSRAMPTGMMMARVEGHFRPHCSAVLIKPDLALGARHCVDALPTGSLLKLYFPLEGFFDVAVDSADFPCSLGKNLCQRDLAILPLTTDSTISPLAYRARDGGGELGTEVLLAGYGVSNTVLSDKGLLREGVTKIGFCGCAGTRRDLPGLICFDTNRESLSGAFTGFASIAGFSGGPMFQGGTQGFDLLGIAIETESPCGSSDRVQSRYIDLRNDELLSELLCDTDCRHLAADSFELLHRDEIAYIDTVRKKSVSVTIKPGTTVLLVNLNHEFPGFRREKGADLDLDLAPRPGMHCERHHGAESCRLNNPAPGAYDIGIKRLAGNPAYQLTVVAIYEE